MIFSAMACVLDFDDDCPRPNAAGPDRLGRWKPRPTARRRTARSTCAQWLSELGFNRTANYVRGIRGNGDLEVGQFPCHFRTYEIGPRAEHLTQLDKGDAKFNECQTHALRRAEAGDRLAVAALDSILDPRMVEALNPIGQAELRQHADDFACPVNIPFQSRQCSEFHRRWPLPLGVGSRGPSGLASFATTSVSSGWP